MDKNRISFRRIIDNEEDRKILADWLSDDELTRYAWNEGVPWTIEKIEDEFINPEPDETVRCIIEYDGAPLGYIQYYPMEEDSLRFTRDFRFEEVEGGYGMDLFIGDKEKWNKGLGPEVITIMRDFLMEEFSPTCIVADPSSENPRSEGAFRKAGFLKEGEVPDYDIPEITSHVMVYRKK